MSSKLVRGRTFKKFWMWVHGEQIWNVSRGKREISKLTLRMFMLKQKTKSEQFDESDSEDEVSLDGSTIDIREHFEIEAGSLIEQFGINCNIFYDGILSTLWNMFRHETSLLVDNNSCFALCLKKDPERIIVWFLSKMGEE